VIDSQFGQIVKGIAAERALNEEAVRALINKAPSLARKHSTVNSWMVLPTEMK
jgi:hypothetical protein